MGNQFQVQTEKLTAAALKVTEDAQKYDSEWKKIYSEVQSLKGTHWEGYASQEFNTKLESYRVEFEKVSKLLKDFATELEGIAKNSEKTEEMIQEGARSLTSGK